MDKPTVQHLWLDDPSRGINHRKFAEAGESNVGYLVLHYLRQTAAPKPQGHSPPLPNSIE